MSMVMAGCVTSSAEGMRFFLSPSLTRFFSLTTTPTPIPLQISGLVGLHAEGVAEAPLSLPWGKIQGGWGHCIE